VSQVAAGFLYGFALLGAIALLAHLHAYRHRYCPYCGSPRVGKDQT
jgi:hypothetical protein